MRQFKIGPKGRREKISPLKKMKLRKKRGLPAELFLGKKPQKS